MKPIKMTKLNLEVLLKGRKIYLGEPNTWQNRESKDDSSNATTSRS